jgi:hypothetical protein
MLLLLIKNEEGSIGVALSNFVVTLRTLLKKLAIYCHDSLQHGPGGRGSYVRDVIYKRIYKYP